MATRSYYWAIEKATGGFSDGSRSGLRDSYRLGKFIDFKTDPDQMGVLYKTQNDSSSTFSALPLWCELASGRVFIYDRDGNLYERVAANTYTLLRAVSSSSGNGLAFYNSRLYYARDAALGYYDMASTFSDSYQTLNSNTYHPLKTFINLLCVGNGRYLATLDDATVWTSNRLSFTPEETVRCIEVWGSYLAIGTQYGSSYSSVPRGNIYLWDGTSQNPNEIVPFTGAIHAMANDNGNLLAIVGPQADLYAYNGGRPVKITEMPLIGTDNVEVLPGAFGAWKNQVRFGTSAGTSNNVLKGIYTYGSANDTYPKVLSFDYAPSNGVDSGAAVNIGMFKQLSATQALMSWEYNGTYTVDRITSEAYATEATYESIIFDNTKPYLMRRPTQIRLILEAGLRTGEYVKVYMRKQGETSFTLVGQTNTEHQGRSGITFFPDRDLDTDLIYSPKGFQHELKLTWGGTGDTRPSIQNVTVLVEEDTEINTGDV